MPSRAIRWTLGTFFGAAIAAGYDGLAQLLILFAADSRAVHGRQSMFTLISATLSALAGIFTARAIVSAKEGPALLRTIGRSVAALGSTALCAGPILLFGFPQTPSRHPGHMPAADMAGGLIATMVTLCGLLVTAAGLAMLFGALVWTRARSRAGSDVAAADEIARPLIRT